MSSASAAASTQLGSFNERGIIKNFERKGFTPGKCLCELVANSLDAMFYAVDRDNRPLPRVQNPKIEFRVTAEYIDIIDNGYGMTLERVRNMLDLNRENHGNHKALGVSGFGFKPATMILSEKSEIYVYTKVLDGESLRVTIPWDQIYASGKYIGMSYCEPAPFPEEYIAMEMGTILRFPYLPSLENIIHANFMDKSVAVLDRMAVIFGHFQVEISYKNAIKNPHKNHVLNMYDYFGGNSLDYYTGQIYEDIIHQYKNNNGEYLFLWENSVDDKTYYIPKSGKGFSKDAKPYTSNMAGWDHYIGEYLVQTGMRVKPEYFDIHNPRMPSQQARFMSEYDKRLIGDIDVDDSGNNNNKKNKKNTAKGDQFDFMAKCKFARTNQLIGCFEWANSKTASARSGVRGTHDGFHTNCYLSYNPNSSSDNIQDITMGIQENKNQYTGEAIPLNMKRLVETIRNKTADIIWEYFEELVGDDKPEPDSSLNDLYGDVDDDASSDVASTDEVDSDVGIISSSTASDDDNSVSSEAPSSSASEASVVPSNVVPSSVVPSNVVPSNVVPSSVVPSNVVPSSVVPSNVVPSSSTATTPSDDNTASSKSAASTAVSASATPSSSESAAASVVPSSTSDDDIDEIMFINVSVIDHTRILIPRDTGVKILRKLMPYAEEVSETIVEILCKINGKEGDKIMKETFEFMRRNAPQMLRLMLQHLYENMYSANENVKCGTTLSVLYNRYIMKK